MVELLEFVNITANASLSGWATRQLSASQDDNAEPFRQRAQDVVHEDPDNETALDAGLPLDFEGQQRDGIVFLGHSKLLRGRARSIRSHGAGVEAARRGRSHTVAADPGVLNSRRDGGLEAHLQPVLNIFEDFLEISSKWYVATVPIVAGYLTILARRSFELPRRPFPCDASREIEKSGLSGGARQTHRKHRALAQFARHGYVAAHQARELAGDGKAESRAPETLRGRGIGLAELREQLGLLLRSHADAGIGDGELDEAAAITHLACRKLHLARFGELARIAEEIEQYLSQSHGVHGQCAEVFRGVNDEPVLVLLGKLSSGADDIFDQRCQLHGLWVELELPCLDLRQVEHLVDEAKKVSPSAVHPLQWLLRLFRDDG